MIGRYLLRTRDIALDCYVDADFVGLWKQEDDQDPICSNAVVEQ